LCSGTAHEEDQPVHLKIKPELSAAPLEGYHRYGGVEGNFCPARVYEWLPPATPDQQPKLQINAANCVHCKSCDIKPYKVAVFLYHHPLPLPLPNNH
jgi:electron-transferring-flavoprotein dehydrogenase